MSEEKLVDYFRDDKIMLSSSAGTLLLGSKGSCCCPSDIEVKLELTMFAIIAYIPSVLDPSNKTNVVLSINLSDVIGSKCVDYHLHIFEYASAPKSCYSSGVRNRKQYNFLFLKKEESAEWAEMIMKALSESVSIPSKSNFPLHCDPNPLIAISGQTPSFGGASPPPFRTFLVFINPNSGTKQALNVFKSITEPMLTEAGISVDLVITQRANHAKEYVQSKDLDLSKYSCICVISGDGLLFEVINGIAQRPSGDGLDILKVLPLAPIPGGTGNGLAKSILFASGDEPYSAVSSTFVAIKGKRYPLDISVVRTLHDTHYAFLSLGWGLISDIDIKSECMRCLGEARLYLGAVYFISRKRFYNGRLSMVLTTKVDSTSSTECASRNDNVPSPDIFSDPSNIEYRKVIEGPFLFVWAVQTSHAAATMHSGPGVRLDDGVFTIYVVRNMSRCEMLQLLIDVDNGDHVKHVNVEVFKASSYCLEPARDSNDGVYSLDGEVIEYGPVSSTMLPSAACILKL
jgi:sphingosine kinase